MGAIAPVTHWIPQDDILLKNSLEAGASLESLAKGAVRFSRRFSVQELQDRWRSLLYDPVVAAEASANMIEFDSSSALQSKSSKFDSARDSKGYSLKRKRESIRRQYYAIRKRICSETLESTDMNFLAGTDFINDGSGHEPPAADYMVENPVSDHFGIQDSNFEGTSHAFQNNGDGEEFGNLEEFPVCDLFETNDLDVKNPDLFGQIVDNGEIPISECGTSFHNLEYPSHLTQGPVWSTMEGVSAATLPDIHHGDNPNAPNSNMINNTAELIAQLSESLMDISNQEDNILDDDDKAYIDNLSSLLLDSPNEGDTSIAPDDYDTFQIDELLGDLGDSHMVPSSEEKMPASTLPMNPDYPEYRNGVICCVLNTEDPDIPSNDDVFLPVRLPSSSFSPFEDWKFHEPHYPMSSSVRDIPTHKKANQVMRREENNHGQFHVSSQVMGSLVQSKISSNLAINTRGAKLELPHNDAQNIVPRNAIIQGPNMLTSTNGNANNCSGSHLEDQDVARDNCIGLSNSANISKMEDAVSDLLHNDLGLDAELGCQGISNPELDLIPTLSDSEECLSETDEDLPCFSDVEAMILDMDLSPDDDIYSSKKALEYQHEESKRTIIRLEQAADAYMQRSMEAHGAFAVLYGRHSKHFIKKPEVLIGRATEDYKVDIDLGREGCGNKISRRQANIKLDMSGSFILKNLGKHTMHVNGREIAPNNSQPLVSGSLIEVRGEAFVVETNRKLIKQYVEGNQTWEQKPTIN